MPIQFIYFDLGNVICNFDHAEGCRRVAELCGKTESDVHTAMFDSGLEIQFELGKLSPDQFAEKFFGALGAECDPQDLMDGMSTIFSPNEAIYPLIRNLNDQGIPLGVLSNTCPAHWDWVIRQYPILTQSFSIRVLSFEVQSMKPDAAIYQAAIESANTDASNIFFMDDRQENVDGALEAGIDAVLYSSVPELEAELNSRGIQVSW